jgi:FAD/FMN-containing dehydrogenase
VPTGALATSLIPPLLAKLSPPGVADYVDESYKVFASPRLVRFYEMEYGVPREAAADALNEVRRYIKRSGLVITFPVEVRFVAADDIPLSMAYGRDTCFIAVHVYQGTQYHQYFEAVEQIMSGYGSRPHWGSYTSRPPRRWRPAIRMGPLSGRARPARSGRAVSNPTWSESSARRER